MDVPVNVNHVKAKNSTRLTTSQGLQLEQSQRDKWTVFFKTTRKRFCIKRRNRSTKTKKTSTGSGGGGASATREGPQEREIPQVPVTPAGGPGDREVRSPEGDSEREGGGLQQPRGGAEGSPEGNSEREGGGLQLPRCGEEGSPEGDGGTEQEDSQDQGAATGGKDQKKEKVKEVILKEQEENCRDQKVQIKEAVKERIVEERIHMNQERQDEIKVTNKDYPSSINGELNGRGTGTNNTKPSPRENIDVS